MPESKREEAFSKAHCSHDFMMAKSRLVADRVVFLAGCEHGNQEAEEKYAKLVVEMHVIKIAVDVLRKDALCPEGFRDILDQRASDVAEVLNALKEDAS